MLEPKGEISWGGHCEKGEIYCREIEGRGEDVTGLTRNWKLPIREHAEGYSVQYTDGSKDKNGQVGSGWYNREKGEGGSLGLGKMATVWDGGSQGYWNP